MCKCTVQIKLFVFTCSLLARGSVKQILHSVIPESVYRPVYVLCSGAVLFFLMYCWQPFGPYIWRVDWAPVIWLLRGMLMGENSTLVCIHVVSRVSGCKEFFFVSLLGGGIQLCMKYEPLCMHNYNNIIVKPTN